MAERIVVKLGTSVLTAGTDRLNRPRMVDLIRQLAHLMQEGHELCLVSSGAVLAGWEHLGFPPRKRTLAEKQLLAAVGQSQLMHLYTQLGSLYDLKVAQTLLVRSDFSDRRRYLNARTTFSGCFEHGLLPIVNENDVVAIDEIRLGDNDTLAAQVAALVEADRLVICSDIQGLYTAAPQHDPAAQLISEIPMIDQRIWDLAGGAGTSHGTGGMYTKIQAADLATRAGINMHIVAGAEADILLRLVAGEKRGSHFLPRIQKLEARKRWILAETVPQAVLLIDEGAAQALLERGNSLLAVGIKEVQGQFSEGQTVLVKTLQGEEVARGLARYNSDTLKQLAGQRADKIQAQLGESFDSVVIHRNDMVMS